MARINISISDELKARMDNHPRVNWSQTASELFLNKINEIESSIEVKNMTDAIVRLKASKAKFTDETKEQGYGYGLEWAMETADYEELLRIQKAVEEQGAPDNLRDLERLITNDMYNIYILSPQIGIDDPAFIDGFIEAALEVLKKADE
ncbi:MAG: hypothetical protein PHG00_09500 [Methylococcales bacterium]|nr:hypothetical protein [Methylococcales bacterium]